MKDTKAASEGRVPGGGRRVTIAAALLCICGGILLALGAGEIYVRLTRPHVDIDALRAKSEEWEPTLFSRHAIARKVRDIRGEDAKQGVSTVHINELGYRGPTFTIEKPPGMVRIVVLGGSGAFDVFAVEGQDWPRLVERRLRADGYQQVEVINAATPGHATWDLLGRLYAEIWMFAPDYVLIYEAWNDIKYFGALRPENTLLRMYRPATTSKYGQQNLVGNPFIYYSGPLDKALSASQLYAHARWKYWEVKIGIPGLEGVPGEAGRMGTAGTLRDLQTSYGPWGPRQHRLNLHLIAAAARQIGARPVFLTQARLVTATNGEADRKRIPYHYGGLSHDALVQAFADTDRDIVEVGRADQIPVLDVSAKMSGQPSLFADHIHTTVEGSRVLADHVAEFLAAEFRRIELPVLKR